VLLGEPSRTAWDLNFVMFGIPVRVAPWFWLVTVLFGAQASDGIGILTWTAAVFVSILVHEMGHAWAMRAYGFHPWIVLYGMGGLASYNPRDAYGSRRSQGSLAQILICAAGPAAGFLLAAALALLVWAAYPHAVMSLGYPWGLLPQVELSNERLANFYNDVFYICVFWGLVNLLPVYPLDGGQIAREMLVRISPGDGIRQSMILSMVSAGAMAVYAYREMHSQYAALFFGYLGYMSFIAYQSYTGRGRWQ
jgi:stage IV sporulation protein FB